MGAVTRLGPRPTCAALVLGLLAALVAGCDLFKVARPEPGTGGSVLVANYSEPESCLYYMRVGIERKDDVGQTAYLGALADSTKDGVGFHAFFDEKVWSAYTGFKPTDWNLDYETQFVPLFLQKYADPYELEWLPDSIHPYDEKPDLTHQILHRRYEVRAVRQAPSPTLLIAVGYADLYFTQISADRWALARWEDRLDPAVGVEPSDPVQRSFGYRRLNGSGG